jgi:quinol monooxygenase YgiN
MTHTPAPFALVVRFTVQPGAENDFDELVTTTTAAIREREPGTLVYACHTVTNAPRQRMFYELYRDRAAREELLEATEVDFLSLADGKTPASLGAADRA